MQANAANPLIALLPWILIFIVFYFILIRPQQKEQAKRKKDHEDLLNGLKKNDEIVTAGGIHGVVSNVKDETVVIRIDDNARLEVEKNSITKKVK